MDEDITGFRSSDDRIGDSRISTAYPKSLWTKVSGGSSGLGERRADMGSLAFGRVLEEMGVCLGDGVGPL